MHFFSTKRRKKAEKDYILKYIFSDKSILNDKAQSIEALNHSQSYSKLLEIYVNTTRFNIIMKLVLKSLFFVITMGTLIAIVYFFYFALDYVFKSLDKFGNLNEVSMEAILSMLTVVIPSISSLIVAFVKIPKIIAEYLFNTKEDSYMNSVIKNIQDYDKAMFAMEHKIEETLIQNKDQNPKNQDEDIEESPNTDAG